MFHIRPRSLGTKGSLYVIRISLSRILFHVYMEKKAALGRRDDERATIPFQV